MEEKKREEVNSTNEGKEAGSENGRVRGDEMEIQHTDKGDKDKDKGSDRDKDGDKERASVSPR